MKKKIIIALICLSGLVGTATFAGNTPTPEDQQTCNYGQCSYIKSNYEQCKNCAQQYSSYCWSHNR